MSSPSGDSRAAGSAGTEALAAEAHPHALVQQFHLRVVSGPDAGATYSSTGERVVIGTHLSADFKLTDTTSSRFHCEIAVSDGRVLVRDLGSRNGTLVDGVVVLAAQLRDGATLAVGRTQIRFDLGTDQIKLPLSGLDRFELLVGRSRAMRRVFELLGRAAASDVTVLIEGETGTGKDAAAESIHNASPRRNGPFVIVDCAALSAALLESELFGHERGAFTGADRERAGAFEAAGGGTVFIDEVGELSLELQPKFLRALERGEIQRLGSSRRIPVDVRVVAATNRNLRTEVNAHRFRSDLYYRLAVLEVDLPPLRERHEDLDLLVEELLARMGTADDPAAAALRTPSFLASLARHPWPGNVRELRNYLERCLTLDEMAPLPANGVSAECPDVDITQPLRLSRERWVRRFEHQYLEGLLRRHDDNVTAAARAAGVDRAYLHRLLVRHRLR